MAWTAEQKAEIVKAYDAGNSATVIGRRFGVSRSAILGLLHRHRIATGKPARVVAPKRAAPRPPRPAPAPRIAFIKPAATGKSAEILADLQRQIAGAFLVPARHLPLVELGAGQCRFAVTPHDAPADGHRFCGAPASGPYCTHHAHLSRI